MGREPSTGAISGLVCCSWEGDQPVSVLEGKEQTEVCLLAVAVELFQSN